MAASIDLQNANQYYIYIYLLYGARIHRKPDPTPLLPPLAPVLPDTEPEPVITTDTSLTPAPFASDKRFARFSDLPVLAE